MSKNLGTSWDVRFNSPRQALNAMVNYLGKRRFKMLVKTSVNSNEYSLKCLCDFAGVSGYPVDVFIDAYLNGKYDTVKRKLKPFYFTFGCGQWMCNPIVADEDINLYGYYTCIYAIDEYVARRIMHDKRGNKWAALYHEEHKAYSIDRFDCKFILWSKVKPQPGPTK